jgi:hypothetical protein
MDPSKEVLMEIREPVTVRGPACWFTDDQHGA